MWPTTFLLVLSCDFKFSDKEYGSIGEKFKNNKLKQVSTRRSKIIRDLNAKNGFRGSSTAETREVQISHLSAGVPNEILSENHNPLYKDVGSKSIFHDFLADLSANEKLLHLHRVLCQLEVSTDTYMLLYINLISFQLQFIP